MDNIQICSLFLLLDFVKSRSEFNRLIKSKGIYVSYASEEDVEDVNCILKMEHVN